MHGWGRFALLLTIGTLLGAGCGGRTGVPYQDGDYDPDPDGGTSSGTGGSRTSGGRTTMGGRTSGGGVTTGGRPIGTAGGGGATNPGGGPAGGAFPVGGFAGFPIGGFGGSFPMGGIGGTAGDCQSCLYQSCSGELIQCFQDFGCLAIFGCMQVTGCSAFDCYSPDTCGDVINQWGGPSGESMGKLFEGVACALSSGCPCN